MTPGKKLARARKRNGFASQQSLAKAVTASGYHITKHRIARLEQDQVKNVGIDEVLAISKAMPKGISLDWWLKDDPYPTGAVKKRIEEMPEHMRRCVLEIIDALWRCNDNI